MEPWSYELAGRFDEHAFESEVLKDNALGDPHVRPLWVYLPPGYDDDPERRYPSIYVIQGLTGQLDRWRNRMSFRQELPGAGGRAVRDGRVAAGDLVWVDAWTSLGGSQFVDSPGTGRYHTYIFEELVPWVDAHYRTLRRGRAPRDHRQVERRLRRDGQPDAAARHLRRTGHARRRRALRDVLPAGVPQVGAGAARPLRRLVRALLGGLPLAAGVREGHRPRAPQRLLHGGLLLGRRGRDRPAALRHRDRRAAAGDLGALARVGPGADGAEATPTRCAR